LRRSSKRSFPEEIESRLDKILAFRFILLEIHAETLPANLMKSKFIEARVFRGETLQALTSRQARLVEAIAARILPTTDTPGAVEAGALYYIDRALAGIYRPLLPRYRRGLTAIEKHAKAKFGASFLKLSESDQDAVLSALEAGQFEELRNGEEFFELLRAHILEGVFGEPSYGGNRDLVGWRLVGFPGQQYGYPDPYIDKVVDLEPVACNGPPKKPGGS
jgi:gluconate 2-dehydrogenase gamma chain